MPAIVIISQSETWQEELIWLNGKGKNLLVFQGCNDNEK